MLNQKIRHRRERLLYAALFGLLAVFAFLCSIWSECIPLPVEVGEDCVREDTTDREDLINPLQVAAYLRDRHLIMTTNEEDDWLEFVQYRDMETTGVWVEPAVVQVICSQQSGSGILIDMDYEHLIYATCAHVIGDEETMQIVFWNEESAQAKVFARSESFDLAFLSVDASRVSYDTRLQLRKARMDETAWEKLSENDPVFIQASSQNAAGDFYSGKMLYKEVFVPEFDCFMVCCQVIALHGMSGGGIFDESGHLIGMINGGTGNGEIVGLSLPVIMGQWGTVTLTN